MKTFMRFQYEQNISLKRMQKKCNTEKRGLCCYEYDGDIDTPFVEQIIDEGEIGEVVIFEGEVWGTCVEGYTAYPIQILQRIKIRCERNKETGYKEFIKI
jgi:hypothetical protein